MRRFIFMSLLFALLAASACSKPAPTTQVAPPVPTVDTTAIAEGILAEVELLLAQPTVTPAPTVDTTAIAAAILSEVESRFATPTAALFPTVDTMAVAQAVLTELDSEFARQAEKTVTDALNDAALAAAGEGIQSTLIRLYRQVNPAVVTIVVPDTGMGSGFVYGDQGHIVTNNHVAENGRSYEVLFSGGERVPAEWVGADVDSDLAVIKVERLPDGVEPLRLAQPDAIQVGEFVVAIGNPFGEQGSMSLGIVSGLGRSLRSQRVLMSGSSYSLPEVVQTDAPINPGNSGGPLLNLHGEVVGVNSAIATTTGTSSGVGFSIPVAAVRRIVPSLIEDGEYTYPLMGASFAAEITLDDLSTFDLPQTQGAYVLDLTPGGPAEQAGLIPADATTGRDGDLIVKIDDQDITGFDDLNSYLVFHATVGQTIEITVLRDGNPVVLSLTLGARP